MFLDSAPPPDALQGDLSCHRGCRKVLVHLRRPPLAVLLGAAGDLSSLPVFFPLLVFSSPSPSGLFSVYRVPAALSNNHMGCCPLSPAESFLSFGFLRVETTHGGLLFLTHQFDTFTKCHVSPCFGGIKSKVTLCPAHVRMAGMRTRKSNAHEPAHAMSLLRVWNVQKPLQKRLLKTQFSAGTGPRLTAAYI